MWSGQHACHYGRTEGYVLAAEFTCRSRVISAAGSTVSATSRAPNRHPDRGVPAHRTAGSLALSEVEGGNTPYFTLKCGFSMRPMTLPNGSATLATWMPPPTSVAGDTSAAPAPMKCSSATAMRATRQ